MKLNKKGYMLVEIIVAFVLTFSIAMYLLNLTIKFKDTSEEIYYSANYSKDKNLVTRNIMDDLEKGTVTYIGKDVSNDKYVNLTLNIDGVDEYRKLKIDIDNTKNIYSIEYGKTDSSYNNIDNNHYSYYKKNLNSGLFVYSPSIVIENNVFSLVIPVKSMYDNENYDIKLIAPCYAVSYMKTFADKNDKSAFKLNYQTSIDQVKFVNEINTAGAIEVGDFSSDKNPGEVTYWVVNESGNQVLYIGSKNTIVAEDLSYLFSGMTDLKSIDFSNLQTVVTKKMEGMFYNCSSLTSLDLSSFDTSSVTNMMAMFSENTNLSNLDVSNFDTSNVENMIGMFYNCSSLTNLNLSNFSTKNVIKMNGMFYNCENLENLLISEKFTTDKVISYGKYENLEEGIFVSGMFSNCRKLRNFSITIRNKSVDNYIEMFKDAAVESGASIIVNYTSETSSLVDNMLNTKSEDSNVIKGELKNN